MTQLTFGDLDYGFKRKRTRRELFLTEMEQVVPWQSLLALTAPVYHKGGKDKQPDPEMHQTKKGNQYYFGMKAHIGVDAEGGLVHTVTTTAANAADVAQAGYLLHGKEEAVFGDAGYVGVEKRQENAERKTQWYIAEKRGKVTHDRFADRYFCTELLTF